MSSLSGAQYEADLPPTGAAGRGATGPLPGPGMETDEQLMRRAQSGERGAYGQIVIRHQDRLYNAILRMVGDREEARELAQEAFTRGLMKLDSFRGDAQPYTWLFRISVNLVITQLRKNQRRRVFSLDRTSRNGAGDDDQSSGLAGRITGDDRASQPPAEQIAKRERDEQVLAALGRLDAEYRAVLVMRDIEGFDYQQMASILDLPLGTLKSRLFRARLALRDQLKAYMDG